MIFLPEIQTAAFLLETLETIQDIDEGKTFIKIYLKAANLALRKADCQLLDTNQVIRFIIQCDSRFGNMV
jgi:hypothetical protein